MSEDVSGFFQRVKDWVKENHKKIDVVLESVGIPKSNYYNWQDSPKDVLPSATYIYRLAKFMGVSVEWLISGEENGIKKAPVDDFQKRVNRAFQKLDDFDKETVAESAESLARRRFIPARPIRILDNFASEK